MSYPDPEQRGSVNPAQPLPEQLAEQGPARRPGVVTATAIIIIVLYIPFGLFAVFVSLVVANSDRGLFGPPALWYFVAGLNLVLTILMLWGAVAVLRGKTNKVLVYAAMFLAALQIVQLTETLVHHYGSPVSAGFGIVIAVFILFSMSARPSRAFVEGRGGTTAQIKPALAAAIPLTVVAVVAAVTLARTGRSDTSVTTASSPSPSITTPSEPVGIMENLVVDGQNIVGTPVGGGVQCTTGPDGIKITAGDPYSYYGTLIEIKGNEVTFLSVYATELGLILRFQSGSTVHHLQLANDGNTFNFSGRVEGSHPSYGSSTDHDIEMTVTCPQH